MSSPSIVRTAGPEDYDEVWRLLMASYSENALFGLSEEKVRWFLNRVIYPEAIPSDDTGARGVIGVIGPVGSIEGLAFLIIGEFWYSYDKHLEELLVFIDPRFRRSEHAKALVRWMRQMVESTGLPLVTGVMSTHRTEAKVRLYERMLPKIGAFFFVSPKGASIAPALVAASS